MLKKILILEKQHNWIAYLYAVLGNIALVIMQIQMKILSRTLSPFFILFIRGLILLGISCIIVRINNLKVHYTDKLVFSMLFKRSILSSVALTCFIGSIPYLPIGIVNSLFNTGPIIIHFLEAVYYKKHLNAIHFILTIVCFVGVLLIVKPGFLFGDKNSFPLLLMCFPLFGALCNSMSMLYLHQLKEKVSNLIALHYFYIGQVFLTGMLQNFEQFEIKAQINVYVFLSLFALVLFALLTQNFVTRAIYLKKASYIMPFGYISIVIASVSDILFFKSSFDWLSILGMTLTSTGLLSKLIIKQK